MCGTSEPDYDMVSRTDDILTIDRLKRALKGIRNVLGPNWHPCPDCCEGCQTEMHEALRIAKEALGERLD